MFVVIVLMLSNDIYFFPCVSCLVKAKTCVLENMPNVQGSGWPLGECPAVDRVACDLCFLVCGAGVSECIDLQEEGVSGLLSLCFSFCQDSHLQIRRCWWPSAKISSTYFSRYFP